MCRRRASRSRSTTPCATARSPAGPVSSPPASGPARSAGTPCCTSTRRSWRTRWCWTSSPRPHRRRRAPEAPPTTCARPSVGEPMSLVSKGAFSRVAIVNRGEPAMRLINAVREWNAEGRPALRVIALYTAPDRRATFVREADEAVLIGPDPKSDADAAFAGSPYLDYAELERALRACRADAVWPGWGFVSEKAEFAELCDRLGITFIGPPAEVMRRLGDKIESKRLAGQADVPLAPWSGDPVADPAEARAQAESIGYPLMVKATAGGGGRGIRLVQSPEQLDEAFERASSEASKTAGDATVFLERAIRGGRHVEVQVVADAEGTVWTLGVRDCSVQRRNQKVIEESASTVLDAEQEKLLRSHAAELVRAAGYVNAGTVEFLYEPSQRLLSFLEVNTRLQVEHPVTEVTTGVDIVKLQLHIAAGGTLAEVGPAEPPANGHAIEARLTAEDPERDFAPAPGLIEHLALPAGPGIRVDTGVAAGDVIPPQFDSMIAKVIAWGRDRCEARARLSRALRQTATVINGGTTNKAFLLDLLSRPEFVRGEVDTTWLDAIMADGDAPPRRVDVALLAPAFEAYEAHARRQQDRLFTSAERGRPEVGHETQHQVDVRVGGEAYRLRVSRSRPGRYQVELDGRSVHVDVERSGRFELRLGVGGQTFDVLSVAQGPDYLVEVDGAVHRISGGEAGLVRAPAPAMVVAIPVGAGDGVAEGDIVAVVESMKPETALRAPVAGRVAEVFADVNTQVENGAKLLLIEPDADSGTDEGAEPEREVRADLGALAASASDTANLVLGVVSTPTERYPEGMRRVVLLGDPVRALGALAEPECRRVLAAIELARRLHVPVEWFAISAGAKIAMDSGTETMEWISRALRGIIEFTQDGGEINVVVTGINVGAQPYWSAEATMLMHTRGVLIMTPDSAMVLTGKQSLDYSGGVSAEDNFGIGGYDRIMGPNGEGQYWAPDLSAAVDAASGNRPVVILANLSGFDGSPESLRQLQLEYGAEIGRAVVNFDGPIVFCVVSRYHGGAFVVFSGTLNDNMEVAAVEGSYASVIGGAPAAAVVFAAEVSKRTAADPRVADLQAAIAEATASGAHDEASALRAKLAAAWPAVH